jgi:diacylglycerol kinase family enzyme
MGQTAQFEGLGDLIRARGILLMNPRSGSQSPSVEDIANAARARGVAVHVLSDDEDAAEIARRADAEALGVAGGDGSLAPVAQVAIERDLPFVCVPLGTRNHFARDLGLDRNDATGALAAFEGEERRVDVARVGGRVFLNNLVVGAYARLVHRRERHRRRRDALARLRALAMVLRHPQPLHVAVDGEPVAARVLLIANNHYDLDLLSLGARERLDEGLLHLYAAEGLLPRTWQERTAPKFRLDSGGHALSVAIDGEPESLDTPVDVQIQPGALRALVPPR